MSYFVDGTTIKLTRGDTFISEITIYQPNGDKYIPREGDSIRFAMKKNVNDEDVLIMRDIPISTMKLILNPDDTKELPYGSYVYDVQLTKANGDVDTFITVSSFIITEEVD